MTFGDVEPAHLYTESVLRKTKQLDCDEKLGLGKISDPIASVLQLKYKLEFLSVIREISKYFIIYFSREQLFLYQQLHRQEKTGMLSIDTTGSLIKNIKKSDESINFIFLYQAVVPYNTKILPVL